MAHRKLQYSIILFVSMILGFLVFLQYKTLITHDVNFEENNSFREIRVLLQGNTEMREKIQTSQAQLESLSSAEAIEKNARVKTQEAQSFSGIKTSQELGVDVIIEGNISLKMMIEIVNTLWNAGADNIELNSVKISFDNAGFDQAGGQILLGNTPLAAPYFFKIYGTPTLLAQVLNPETGALRAFVNDTTKISLSIREQ